jgi:tetratricopeptide (TPR) repeat protein
MSTQYFIKAINLNANYYKAYINLANAYSNINMFDKAIKWYKILLKKNPNFTEAYVYMAEIYMLISDQTNAYKMLSTGLKKGYKNWNYLLNYSRGLRTAREYGWFKKLIKKYKR